MIVSRSPTRFWNVWLSVQYTHGRGRVHTYRPVIASVCVCVCVYVYQLMFVALFIFCRVLTVCIA